MPELPDPRVPGGAAPPGVDAATAADLARLLAAKRAAVAAEDYDEAKRLKAAEERLRAVGAAVAALEARCAPVPPRARADAVSVAAACVWLHA